MYRQNTFNVLLIRGTVHFTRDLENNISVDLSNICGIFILTTKNDSLFFRRIISQQALLFYLRVCTCCVDSRVVVDVI